MLLILLVVLILAGVGVWPSWGWHTYNYGPSGVVGILLVILILWMFFGHRV